MDGDIAKQTFQLPEPARAAFLATRLPAGHRTQVGNCGSNISEWPCETALSCLGGCVHYLRKKNDPVSRVRLIFN